MDRNWQRVRVAALAGVAVAVAACGGQAAPTNRGHQASTAPPKVGFANIGGYRLAYECAGTGRPAVILPLLARRTRVCTYDRAGDGLSEARPASVRPLTGATQARELHTLLGVIGVGPP